MRERYLGDCGDLPCPTPYGAAIFALESSCELSSDLNCAIEALSTSPIFPPTLTETIECGVETDDNTTISPCIQPKLTLKI